MNFVLEIAARDEDFTKLMTTNGNLPTRLMQQEEQVIALKAEW